MNKIFLLFSLAAVLLCGCNKQAKINSEKIELLSQNILLFEQNQARQMAAIETKLTSLGPMLDKMNDFYFEKSHDQAYFFHTNTLYLMLTVDKKIESQLQEAATERATQDAQTYGFYTNQMAALALCTAQIQDALTNQESRIGDKVNAETRRVSGDLSVELQKQIITSANDPAGVARQKVILAEVAEIKADLELIKTRLGLDTPK